jgi:hypothetical protein
MKQLIGIASSIFILVACKKDNDNSNCKLSNATYYNASNTITSNQKYDYDATGRIIKITELNSNTVSSYSYYPDSVVMKVNNSIPTVYYLGSNGLADSAFTNYIGSPELLKSYYKYTYNSEGFLTEERHIFSQLFNGNILLDTSYTTFTIANGNIVKISGTQMSEDEVYEYSSELSPSNNPTLSPWFGSRVSFLGKASKNLLSKTKNQSGVVLSEISYQSDKRQNIIKTTSKTISNGETSSIVYTYSCN